MGLSGYTASAMRLLSAIAYYTLLEAWRARLLLLLAAALALLLALGFFMSQLAIIDSARVQVNVYAAGARLAAVFLLCTHVLGSISREFSDKGIDVLLALDVPRAHYILGKLAGFAALAVLAAAVVWLPLAAQAPWPALLQWGAALALELTLMAAFALFCATAFGQFVPAAALVLAFYLLARSLGAIQQISAHPVSGAGTAAHDAGRWLVDILALVMPALDRSPQTAWLIDVAAPWPSFAAWLAQAVAYVVVLAGAAMVDFQRRNF